MLSIYDLIKMTGMSRAIFCYHIKEGNLRAERFGANKWAVTEEEWQRFCNNRKGITDGRYKQI